MTIQGNIPQSWSDIRMKVSDSKFKILEEGTNRMVSEVCFKDVGNVPIGKSQNIPLDVLGRCGSNGYHNRLPSRRYIKAKCIEALAISKYKQNGRGISFNDLLSNGLAKHKEHAQAKLKYCLRTEILFTPSNHKPQQYYPACFKSEILNKIIPVGVMEVPYLQSIPVSSKDAVVTQTLEAYVLPILPKLPASIHKIQLELKLNPQYYDAIRLLASSENRGKKHEEIVASVLVRYIFYPNGRIMIFVACSNTPFKLEKDDDLGRLIAFLGAVRDRLVVYLCDRHERAVPDIMQWHLTECEINRDVKVSDWMQFTGLNIQVRHAFHLFRIYIKAKGQDSLFRVEESITLKNKPVIEAITDIFNPTERLEKRIAELAGAVNHLLKPLSSKDYESFRISNCVNIDPSDVKKGGS